MLLMMLRLPLLLLPSAVPAPQQSGFYQQQAALRRYQQLTQPQI
jgi:hypothetical protein